jgi:SET domain-containing protein
VVQKNPQSSREKKFKQRVKQKNAFLRRTRKKTIILPVTSPFIMPVSAQKPNKKSTNMVDTLSIP